MGRNVSKTIKEEKEKKMIIESKNGSEWLLDEGLRTIVHDLLIEFQSQLPKVLFPVCH